MPSLYGRHGLVLIWSVTKPNANSILDISVCIPYWLLLGACLNNADNALLHYSIVNMTVQFGLVYKVILLVVTYILFNR